jgi:hypothetical protein
MKSKIIYLGALFTVTPFLFNVFTDGQEPIRFSKELFICLAGLIPLSVLIWKKTRLSLACAFLYVGANMCLTGFGPAQHYNFIGIALSLSALIPLIGIEYLDLKKLTEWIGVSGFLMSCWALMQYLFGYDPFFKYINDFETHLPVGFMGQQTVLGPYLAMTFACAVFTRQHILASFIMFGIYATNSSFSYLCLCVVFYFMCFHVFSKWKILAVNAVGAIASVFVVYKVLDGSNNIELFLPHGRLLAWKEIFGVIDKFSLNQHLFGTGVGTFKFIFTRMESEWLIRNIGLYLQAHNEFIQAYFELGLAGLLIFFWIIVDATLIVIKNRSAMTDCWAAIFFIVLANSLGSFPLHLQPHGLFFLASFLIIATHKERPHN